MIDLETAYPLEPSAEYVFFLAEDFQRQHDFRHQPRLAFLHGVYAHPENYRILKFHASLEKLDQNILTIIENSTGIPSEKSLKEINIDILRQAKQESDYSERPLVTARDLMVATILFPPPPIGVVLERAGVQRVGAVFALRQTPPFKSSASQSQEPETF